MIMITITNICYHSLFVKVPEKKTIILPIFEWRLTGILNIRLKGPAINRFNLFLKNRSGNQARPFSKH